MRISPDPLILFTQLIDCPVWDSRSGQILGLTHQVWLDKQLHQVIGLTYRSLDQAQETRSLPWERVEAVSPEGVWVNVSENTVLILQSMSSIHYQLGEEVWSKTGHRIGTLIDYSFEAKTGAILQYHCAASESLDWNGSQRLLKLSACELNHRCDRWVLDMDRVSPSLETPQPQDSLPKFLDHNLVVLLTALLVLQTY